MPPAQRRRDKNRASAKHARVKKKIQIQLYEAFVSCILRFAECQEDAPIDSKRLLGTIFGLASQLSARLADMNLPVREGDASEWLEV